MSESKLYHDGIATAPGSLRHAAAGRPAREVIVHGVHRLRSRFIESRPCSSWPPPTRRAARTAPTRAAARASSGSWTDATLAFPSYDGNGMFQSLGNVLVNPQVGLLFIDFESPQRLRVNGRASMREDDPLLAEFVGAQLIVRVGVDASFPTVPATSTRWRWSRSRPTRRARATRRRCPRGRPAPMFREVLPPRRLGRRVRRDGHGPGSARPGVPLAMASPGALSSVLALVLLVASGCARAPAAASRDTTPFSVVEATIPEMQKALADGRVTSRELVLQYLVRIALYEDKLNAVDHREPARARGGGRARPRARRAGSRGPLHGIPIALKDNIHTTDMPTTGGALAFDGLVPPYEATLTKNLRDAGAIIIAKTVLTELANWVAGAPTPMPANYNALARLRLQPLRPAARSARGHLRRPAGAGHRRLQLRHRHRGQLLGRQRRHRDLGLDPQPGEPEHAGRRSSRRSAASAATASSRSPPTRTPPARWRARSTDAAILLGVLEGAAPDPNDPATRRCPPPPRPRLHALPQARRAEGRAHRHPARVLLRQGRRRPGDDGAARRPQRRPGEGDGRGHRRLKQQGAVIVDPADIPSVVDTDADEQLPAVEHLLGASTTPRARTRTARSSSSTG